MKKIIIFNKKIAKKSCANFIWDKKRFKRLFRESGNAFDVKKFFSSDKLTLFVSISAKINKVKHFILERFSKK